MIISTLRMIMDLASPNRDQARVILLAKVDSV